ncbi:hypothetical protein [Bradyrhizobium iriomotense]|uniref:hypothetical protein n=1 Tax=Bradyrhizobium iriomotense TaxID=441950 RepID=UPI001B89F496|nr:hypothetical protein [Bradyrhizobium iriomotense]MBR1132514.1 hypothetical protein [Bradyrhizobium iriomotense]
MSVPFWTRGDFELTLHLKNDFTDWGDRNELAVCMFAPGGATGAACPIAPDFGSGAAQARQRQPDDLAVRAVSARLARVELIALGPKSATPRKRNIIAWRRPFRPLGAEIPNTDMSVATSQRFDESLAILRPVALANTLKNRAEVVRWGQ